MKPQDDDSELGPRRILPALPDQDPVLGEIRWTEWERALIASHIPADCDVCAYPGPLRVAMGQTHYTPEPTWERVARSTQTRDGRSKWVKVQHRSYWCFTHWAQRCPHCDEMNVYRTVAAGDDKKFTRIHRHPYTVARKAPPADGMQF